MAGTQAWHRGFNLLPHSMSRMHGQIIPDYNRSDPEVWEQHFEQIGDKDISIDTAKNQQDIHLSLAA